MFGLLIVALAYLLGSIPFGYVIVRASKHADIRETGSGGTGATNVSRRAGKGAGVLTLLLDALKGAASILVARLLLAEPAFSADASWWIAAAAIAVIVGHIFPVWLGFRGGKGVATGVGVFLILAPLAVAFAGVIFLVIVLLTRYVSLGSIVAAATIPLFVLIRNYITPQTEFGPLLTVALVGAALIIFAHRSNIVRIIKGSESKFR